MEGSNYALFHVTIWEFTFRDWEKPQKKSGKVVSVPVKIQPEYRLYTVRSIITWVNLHVHYSTSLQAPITFCITTHHQLPLLNVLIDI